MSVPCEGNMYKSCIYKHIGIRTADQYIYEHVINPVNVSSSRTRTHMARFMVNTRVKFICI